MIPYALFALLIVLNLLDIATTERVFSKGGREANPVMRWLMETIGRPGAYAVKLAVIVAVGYYCVVSAWYALIILCLGYSYVVWHNWRLFR